MQQNMGTVDRALRIITAIAIALAWAFGYIEGVFAIVVLVIAAIFFFTAMLGFCPLYAPFKISTKKKTA
jgi:uncharacterized membrane protein